MAGLRGLFGFPLRVRAVTCAAAGAVAVLLDAGAGRAQFEPRDPAAGQAVELELVLAVDTSSSVSPEEFDLQMRGFAGAFREPAVIAAIGATGAEGVAVSMIQWSDNRRQQVAVDWQLLTDEDSVADFAAAVDGTPRYLDGGGTAIGGAIEFAMAELGRNAFDGRRKVIDISGDGRANQGAQPDGLRDVAVLQGITINGLAILNEDSSVADYYRNNVIGGEGAFVMTANDYESFSLAILEKLIKEIGSVPVAGLPRQGGKDAPKLAQAERATASRRNPLEAPARSWPAY
ncbi:MAG: DUF1194 domain-containing protein [Kiloniellaceae bacterium]|nr:DUF1194 domain-containing protein [Kiloniellaceae bacterium]